MNRIITDLFVWDQLPEKYAKESLLYDFDEKSYGTGYRLSISGKPEKAELTVINNSKRIFVPLIKLDEPMPKSAYHKNPFQVKDMLESFIRFVVVDLPIVTASSLREAISLAQAQFKKDECAISTVVYSADQLHNKEIWSKLYDAPFWNIPIEGIKENEFVFFADPEFIGAFAVSSDYAEVGAFLCSKNIIKISVL
jgi:hypothetical protein